MIESHLTSLSRRGIELLAEEDPLLHDILEKEYQRQMNTLALVASSSIIDPSVLACETSVASNVTAEGYPGRRFHAGCKYIDEIETLAINRAKAVFKAQYANVQPHCASSANQAVMFSLLNPGDVILGMELQAGGHLTHGAPVSISGKYFQALGYGLDADSYIDYEQVRRLAQQHRPRLIICGATSYPRAIDFKRFREIADEVGAFLLADITHIAGLVAAGAHQNPIDHAHFTTTCTHKQLYGPRGGLILIGQDYDSVAPNGKKTLSEMMQNGVFPLFQGAPVPNAMAAKARALARLDTPEFKMLGRQIVDNARALAGDLMKKGYEVISGGTDTHIVLVDVHKRGLTGIIAQNALEASGIIVNKNKIPRDIKGAAVTSGIRLGTNSVALRGMRAEEMKQCVDLIDTVLTTVKVLGESEYGLNEEVRNQVEGAVRELCNRFVPPRYLSPAYAKEGGRN